jgi:AraC-like DNA-binding protein
MTFSIPIDKHLTSSEFLPDGVPLSIYHTNEFTDFPLHTHEFSEIVIVLRGEGIHLVDDTEHHISAGDVFVIHGDKLHGYRDLRKFDHINLVYMPALIDLPTSVLSLPGYQAFFAIEPLAAARQPVQRRLHLSAVQLDTLSQLIDQLSHELSEKLPCYTEMSMMYFQQIVIFLSRLYGQQRTPLSDRFLKLGHVITLLEQEFISAWTVDSLADAVCMSRRSLTRQFTDVMGVAPITYLIHIRLEQAAKLLVNTDQTITDIALQVGFYDSNYLCKQFRRVHGITPFKYRVNSRK